MNTKLILVEGLPSSGKTTTAQMVHDIFNNMGIKNEYIYEGHLNHPADYDGVSYFTKEEYNNLLELFASESEYIDSITTKRDNGYYLEYKRGNINGNFNLSEELFKTILKRDIYELSLENHIDIMLYSWVSFANEAIKKDKVYIFDCAFIQNPVTVTMIRNNSSKDAIIDYIKALEGIIRKLNPVLLYINQRDIEYAFNKSIYERPNEWYQGFINYYTKQGYGKAKGLKGLDGTIEVLKARKKLENDIINMLSIDKYILDNSEFNLQKHRVKVQSILDKYI